jgi:very-short-patch-repair endonuclease
MNERRTNIARRLRRDSTGCEDLLWQQLRNRRLAGLKFRRQVPIAGFVADFCCYDLGLTIEIDGKQHVEQADGDAARRAFIEKHGFIELRFTNDEVKERLDWVVREILRAVDIARTKAPRESLPRRN